MHLLTFGRGNSANNKNFFCLPSSLPFIIPLFSHGPTPYCSCDSIKYSRGETRPIYFPSLLEIKTDTATPLLTHTTIATPRITAGPNVHYQLSVVCCKTDHDYHRKGGNGLNISWVAFSLYF